MSFPSTLQEIVVVVKDITASRYTTGAALVLFLCDTIQNLGGDISLVLPSSMAVALAYFLNRFLAFLALLGVNYALSGLSHALSDRACQALLGSDLTLGVISVGLTDALVTMEVWRLWDMNVTAGRILLGAFLVTNAAGLTLMAVVDITHLSHASYQPILKACVILPVPKTLIAAVYGSGLFFESAVFISTMINVLHKPRNSHTTLATLLYRDGCLFFIAVSGLRFANTVVMVVSRESTNYLVNHLVWVFVLILLNRLVRNQCRGRKGSEHRALGSNANGMGVIIAREVDVELDTFCRSTRSTM